MTTAFTAWATRRDDVRAILTADRLPRSIILALVQALDLHMRAACESSKDEPAADFIQQLLARAALATAALVAQATPKAAERILVTRDAAEAYARDSSEQHWAAFFRAATASYPFGPGDGCMAVDELGEHSDPGAGCMSGSGFIAHVGSWAGDAAVLEVLRRDLLPWLR